MLVNANFISKDIVYTVSEISSKIKYLIENEFGFIKIRGEISGLKIAASGHCYLNLKDKDSIISATCWRPIISKLNFHLEDGMEVLISGKLTTYSGQSKYQITVENIEPAGEGALMQMLLKRKEKLQEEGLFDSSRKKPLPFFPKKIGIVTSITGAVIKDMLHRIKDRCPIHVLIWHCSVQGEKAAFEVASAIENFNKLSDEIRPELIIVARGGGSIEDLWAFNEEITVRAVANSKIPIISAIGHETDFTLTDFAADVRAPTPTAAAEFAVPVLSELKYNVKYLFGRLEDTLYKIILNKKRILKLCDNIISNPITLIMNKQQKLDYLLFKITDIAFGLLSRKKIYLDNMMSKIHSPKNIINIKIIELKHLTLRLNQSMEKVISKNIDIVNMQGKLLETLDYKNVLKRGFALVKSDNNYITSAKKLAIQNESTIMFSDGNIEVLVKK